MKLKNRISTIVALLVLVPMLCTSCANKVSATSSGKTITEKREVASFHGVVIQSGFIAEITQSNTQSVTIEAPEDYMPNIQTTVSDGILTVKFENNNKWGINTAKPRKVYISVPILSTIKASGGSKLTCNGTTMESDRFTVGLSGGSVLDLNLQYNCSDFTGSASGGSKMNLSNIKANNKFSVELSGGSVFNLSSITSNTFTASSSGGSKINLNGSAQNVNISSVSGGGQINATDFSCDDATIGLSGGSKVKLTVNKSLTVNASGGSKVEYKGTPPSIKQNTSGGSKVVSIN